MDTDKPQDLAEEARKLTENPPDPTQRMDEDRGVEEVDPGISQGGELPADEQAYFDSQAQELREKGL